MAVGARKASWLTRARWAVGRWWHHEYVALDWERDELRVRVYFYDALGLARQSVRLAFDWPTLPVVLERLARRDELVPLVIGVPDQISVLTPRIAVVVAGVLRETHAAYAAGIPSLISLSNKLTLVAGGKASGGGGG